MIDDTSTIPTSGQLATTVAIVNSYSTTGVDISASNITLDITSGIKQTLSGALTAGVLKDMLTISGSGGEMSQCVLINVDATARTMRLKVVADGYTAFDSTSASVAATPRGMFAAGYGTADGPPIKWKTSLVISIASSLSETDKLILGLKYNTVS